MIVDFLNQCVSRVAIRLDCRHFDAPMLVFDCLGSRYASGTVPNRLVVYRVYGIDFKSDILHSVSVPFLMRMDLL